MLNTRNRYVGLAASSAFAALLISCASDGGNDGTRPEDVGQPGPEPSTSSHAELENKDILLRAAQGSAGAAKAGAKSCFDGFGACVADSGVIDQACVDQLTGCLPAAPPVPMGCPTLPEPTPEQIAAADDAVGELDEFTGEVIDFVGEVEEAVDDLAGEVEQVVGEILDGGIPLPPPGSGIPRGPGGGRNKSGGGRGGDGGSPQLPVLPPIAPDLTIGGGEVCGVPLPTVPVGELKACADQAATDLQAGTDVIAVATSAIECIEAPFQADIAALCGDATSLCGQPDAPPNICAHVSEVCSALTGP